MYFFIGPLLALDIDAGRAAVTDSCGKGKYREHLQPQTKYLKIKKNFTRQKEDVRARMQTKRECMHELTHTLPLTLRNMFFFFLQEILVLTKG